MGNNNVQIAAIEHTGTIPHEQQIITVITAEWARSIELIKFSYIGRQSWKKALVEDILIVHTAYLLHFFYFKDVCIFFSEQSLYALRAANTFSIEKEFF